MRRAWAVLLVVAAYRRDAANRARRRRHRRRQLFRRGQPVRRPLPRSLRPHARSAAQIKRELEGLSSSQSAIAVLRDLSYAQTRDALTLRAEVGPVSGSDAPRRAADLPRRAGALLLRPVGGRGLPLRARPHARLRERAQLVDDRATASSARRRDGHAPLPRRGARRRRRQRARRASTRSTSGSPGRRWRSSATTPSRPGSSPSSRRSRSATSWPTIARARTPTTPSPRACTGWSRARRSRIAGASSSRTWASGTCTRSRAATRCSRTTGRRSRLKNPMQQGGTVVRRRAGAVRAAAATGTRSSSTCAGGSRGTSRASGYSEAWELFASATPLACDAARRAAYNPACNPALTTNAYQNEPFTGITTIENYASLGADIGARRAGRSARALPHRVRVHARRGAQHHRRGHRRADRRRAGA